MRMNVCIFESLQLEGSYVGDLLYNLMYESHLIYSVLYSIFVHLIFDSEDFLLSFDIFQKHFPRATI